MKGINKAIIIYSLSIIFFTGISIFLVVYLTNNYITNSIRSVYEDNKFMIDIEPKIDKNLEIVDDKDGVNLQTNHVNVTNNGDKRAYAIRLEPLVDYDSDVRVNLDNRLVRDLSKFKKDDHGYIIYEGVLNKGISSLHKVGMWQNINSQKDSIKVNFKIKVEIIEE